MFFVCFFFQAEDGIRDGRVTGVQTCALPIFAAAGDIVRAAHRSFRGFALFQYDPFGIGTWLNLLCLVEWIAYALGRTGSARRSEERRVGKEGRSRGWTVLIK